MARRPKRLKPEDTIALIAPASPPHEIAFIDMLILAIEESGFRVKTGKALRNRIGFLAGNDQARARDLEAAMLDPDVQAVFCLRGGYGSSRILSLLDYGKLKANLKVFVGFSDITALHCALQKKAGYVTFHAPVGGAFLDEGHEFAFSSLMRSIMKTEPPGSVLDGMPDSAELPVSLRKGCASGIVAGGNLSILCSLIGTPFFPSLRGKILFIEDVGEAPYRIDRLLTQLLNSGVLNGVAGIVCGAFNGCIDPCAGTAKEYRQGVFDVVKERLYPLGVPLVYGIHAGHQALNATIPIGARASLHSGRKADLIIEEAAVR